MKTTSKIALAVVTGCVLTAIYWIIKNKKLN